MNARVYIVPGGNITSGSTLKWSGDVAEATREVVSTSGKKAKRGKLRYIADNTTGENRNALIPLVELSPNGDLSFKSRDNLQEMAFDLNIMTRTGYEQAYINGEPV